MSKTAKRPATRKGTKIAKAATAKKARTTKSAGAKANANANTNGKAKAKKLSALDAAAKVLASANAPMTAKEMIKAMVSTKLWSSPGGKTPHATLYSAILREITTKGKDARFKKTERGKFTASP